MSTQTKKLVTMATTTKTQQVVNITTLHIEENFDHKATNKVSICNLIKLTNSLKVTAVYPPNNNSEKGGLFNILKLVQKAYANFRIGPQGNNKNC